MVVWIEIEEMRTVCGKGQVTTCVVVWIEILTLFRSADNPDVTTCVVVWIEIRNLTHGEAYKMSPPAWWCGLKYTIYYMVGSSIVSPPAWWCGLK